MLFAIAWRNLWRNARRTLLSMFAIAFAVIILLFMMALQKGSYEDMIKNSLRLHTSFMQVQRTGYLDDKFMHLALTNVDEIVRMVDNVEYVEACAPRINAPALVSFGKHTSGAVIFGVDPKREAEVTSITQLIRKGTYLDPENKTGAIIGTTLAKNIGANIGDKIAYFGQGADGSMAPGLLTVIGIYSTGTPELDKSSLMAIYDTIAETYTLEGRAHEVAVKIDSLKHLDQVQSAIAAKLNTMQREKDTILTWVQLLPGVKQGIDMDWKSGQIMYAVLLMVVGFGIMNTFLMSFMERIREFGVLLSIGMRPLQISRLIAIEAMLLTISGLIVGLILGSLLTYYFQVYGINLGGAADLYAQYGMSPVLHPALSWNLVWRTSIAVVVIAFVVAIYPAYKVTTLRPVEAIRYV